MSNPHNVVVVRPILDTSAQPFHGCSRCNSRLKNGKLQCDCGEEEGMFEWTWDGETSSRNTLISTDGREVLFHAVYSAGTGVVRGTAPFQQNRHYYFEVKITTYLYGTDFMIGVGTDDLSLTDYESLFCSVLGSNDVSWGYSYRGLIQHASLSRTYGVQFGMGSFVGAHVDMCAGTLEYYVNGKPMGVAFRGLRRHVLYPVVCSTAAQSVVRLCTSVSFEPTLQFACIKEVVRRCNLSGALEEIPGLKKIISRRLRWIIPKKIAENTLEEQELELEDEVVLPFGLVCQTASQRTSNAMNKWGVYVPTLKKDESDADSDTGKKLHGLNVQRPQENSLYPRSVDKVPALFHIVAESSPLESDCRHCAVCNFRLGTSPECVEDTLCSLCEDIV